MLFLLPLAEDLSNNRNGTYLFKTFTCAKFLTSKRQDALEHERDNSNWSRDSNVIISSWIPLQWKNFLACEYSRLPTPQLTTRHSGPYAGEKKFLAKRDILCSQANKDSFVNQSSKLAEEELTCDSYKYINALQLLSEAMCMVIKLITKGVSPLQVFAVNKGAPHVPLLHLLASQT